MAPRKDKGAMTPANPGVLPDATTETTVETPAAPKGTVEVPGSTMKIVHH